MPGVLEAAWSGGQHGWSRMSRQAAAGRPPRLGEDGVSFYVNAGPSEGFELKSESRGSSGSVGSSWTPDMFDGRTNRISCWTG